MSRACRQAAFHEAPLALMSRACRQTALYEGLKLSLKVVVAEFGKGSKECHLKQRGGILSALIAVIPRMPTVLSATTRSAKTIPVGAETAGRYRALIVTAAVGNLTPAMRHSFTLKAAPRVAEHLGAQLYREV